MQYETQNMTAEEAKQYGLIDEVLREEDKDKEKDKKDKKEKEKKNNKKKKWVG